MLKHGWEYLVNWKVNWDLILQITNPVEAHQIRQEAISVQYRKAYIRNIATVPNQLGM